MDLCCFHLSWWAVISALSLASLFRIKWTSVQSFWFLNRPQWQSMAVCSVNVFSRWSISDVQVSLSLNVKWPMWKNSNTSIYPWHPSHSLRFLDFSLVQKNHILSKVKEAEFKSCPQFEQSCLVYIRNVGFLPQFPIFFCRSRNFCRLSTGISSKLIPWLLALCDNKENNTIIWFKVLCHTVQWTPQHFHVMQQRC